MSLTLEYVKSRWIKKYVAPFPWNDCTLNNFPTFFEPFSFLEWYCNHILYDIMKGSVSLSDWSEWNIAYYVTPYNAHLITLPSQPRLQLHSGCGCDPSIQPSNKIDWHADAAGVRLPGGQAEQGDFFEVLLEEEEGFEDELLEEFLFSSPRSRFTVFLFWRYWFNFRDPFVDN